MLHKITFMLSVLLLTPVLTARGAADTVISSPIPFTIHTHGIALTEEDIKAVLDAAHKFLTDDGVSISFDPTHSFDLNHNVIDEGKVSECSDLMDLLNRKDVNVHIVDNIPCCGKAQQKGIVGCSGPNIAIIALPGNHSMDPKTLRLRAIQWMHELGHNKGLSHTCQPTGIMISDPGFNDTKLDACDKLVFNGGTPFNQICILSRQSCMPTSNQSSGPQQ